MLQAVCRDDTRQAPELVAQALQSCQLVLNPHRARHQKLIRICNPLIGPSPSIKASWMRLDSLLHTSGAAKVAADHAGSAALQLVLPQLVHLQVGCSLGGAHRNHVVQHQLAGVQDSQLNAAKPGADTEVRRALRLCMSTGASRQQSGWTKHKSTELTRTEGQPATAGLGPAAPPPAASARS